MDMVIVEGEEAVRLLRQVITIHDEVGPCTLRFAVDGGGIKVKVNAGCWSPPIGRMAENGY